jgi:predicted Rossmann fold flavoprotein
MLTHVDVIIVGAGASGLMCAIEAAKRGRSVWVLDHANKAGKKILMSGGGRCNFTNYSVEPENYLSANPHFCKSALSRFSQWDFLALVNKYQIAFHEREHGQLFCDNSAKDILNMLLTECRKVRVDIRLNTPIKQINRDPSKGFLIKTEAETIKCQSLVIASGGLSVPKMGATPFGYRVAEQFGLSVNKTFAGLVPFTWQEQDRNRFAELSGIAVPAVVSNQRNSFNENILFTHRGLSGPVILQISSYWQAGETVVINLLPNHDLRQLFKQRREQQYKGMVKTILQDLLPKRLTQALLSENELNCAVQNVSDNQINKIVEQLQCWQFKPNGTEGYRTAEVTVGGVDCNVLSSKTMECLNVPDLYFIGEVVDVTGWLGGYNFQWAWSSGWCAGQFV